ncbi:SWIM zinc finger family protein [Ruminococcus sp.]|uniref:SWIM zinc finger family protein n=1 Tax=Ruminococcus sp. TaxID=41978 RepID=UPI0025CDE31E|nr:SWIM zinc finger family protein [Ruminococcus sp.]
MNWKKIFKNNILEKGHDYYLNGKTKITECSNNNVEATVFGTEEYHVSISFSNGDVDGMYCNCPYATDGNNCKHMASVLYALEDSDNISASNPFDAESLVNIAEPELIREFLLKSIRNDLELRYRFIRFWGIKKKRISISEYQSHIDTLIMDYLDEYGMINWEDSLQFFNEAQELIKECTDKLIEEKRFLDVFAIVRYYSGKIMYTEIDNEEELFCFQNYCLEILQRITEMSDMDTKRLLFSTSLELLHPKFHYVSGFYLDYIRSSFPETEFLEEMLKYSDMRTSKDCRDYELITWVLYHLELMDALKYEDDKIMQYSKKYWHLSRVRKYILDRCISKDDIQTAIKILEDNIKSDNNTWDAKNAHLKLKDLYRQSGDKKNYVKELWIILTEYNTTDKNVYIEFKSLFDSDEWEEVREKLYSSMKNQEMLPEYFIEENLKQRLLSYIYSNKDIFLIEKYESFLAEDYSEFILNEYKNYLNKAAEHKADRFTYRIWANKLKHMKTIKGGKECVNDIICTWKTLYHNRRAMMQEISIVDNEN